MRSLSSKTSPDAAEAIFILLEIIILALTVGSIVLFGVAIWVMSLDQKEKRSDWFFQAEIYWNGSIFGLTLAAVLLVFAASEKHLAQREALASDSDS